MLTRRDIYTLIKSLGIILDDEITNDTSRLVQYFGVSYFSYCA